MGVGTRRCPECLRATDQRLCPSDGTSTLASDLPRIGGADIVLGMVIAGRYRVDQKLGAGGFGSVFAATHLGTRQRIAIKVLDAPGDDHVSLVRFFREAKVTARLAHPHTVRVFDFGQDDSGAVFIAMEFLEGHTLSQEIRKRPAPFGWREAAEVALAVLESLTEAHAAGLVHRDLKPENVMLHRVLADEAPVVKVLDFGVARLHDSELTVGGTPCTPEFVSPEQARGLPIDARSDLYAVGVMLFMMCTRQLPFMHANRVEIMRMHVYQPAPDPRRHAALPAAFAAVIGRALEKDPAARFADAAAMRAALEAALAEPDPELTVFETMEPGTEPTYVREPTVTTQVSSRGTAEDPTRILVDHHRTRAVPIAEPYLMDTVVPIDTTRLTAPPPPRSVLLWVIAAAAAIGVVVALVALRLHVPAESIEPSTEPTAISVTPVAVPSAPPPAPPPPAPVEVLEPQPAPAPARPTRTRPRREVLDVEVE